ncbi:MAG TPA: redoxin domain-containing protein [Gemmatimonadales bacterium]|nr:redoxin domain-containing protein [Gemmatimonadales bacterium]
MDAYRDQYATLFRGGSKVVLLAVSVDPDTALASWARDKQYPFRFLSDTGGVVGRRYGAWEPKYKLDNRTLYVVGRDGKIAYVADPFLEIDPRAYTDLKAAIDKAAGM